MISLVAKCISADSSSHLNLTNLNSRMILTTSYTDLSNPPIAYSTGKEHHPKRRIGSKMSTAGRGEYGKNHSGCHIS
ncbi:hypothetical protein ACN38_g5024 [Penicillium nordicum]|uniref:Uncharacterized protein n=1 Tax=Penicillium nordicum TaxID=229535 RepID=A0A0M9WGL3_9EURO|nr:hypothetical protein ACN38_g5024 [Penicillium nordicum]